jgi:Domain of unknown function (DUF222)
MFQELEQLRQLTVEFASRFDAGGLTPGQAGTAVRMLAQAESSIGSMKALAAARAAESEGWKKEGFRSAADELASRTGVGVGRARQTLDAGRRMASQPEVAEAALAGDLSPEQAALVSDGAAAAPGRAKELVEKAKQVSIGELTDEVARVKAAHTDLEKRRQAIQARRSWKYRTTTDGEFRGFVFGHPEDGALLYRMLTPIKRRLTILARQAGRRDPFEAIEYDSLMTLARLALGETAEIDVAELLELGLFPQLTAVGPFGPATATAAGPPDLFPPDGPDEGTDEAPDPEPAGPPPPGDGAGGEPPGGDAAQSRSKRRRSKRLAGSPAKVIGLVDLDALLRGAPVDGERCEILGFGPVAMSVIEGLLSTGNTQLALALTHHQRVIGVHHARRRPNAHQKTALEALYPECAVLGCNSRAGLQYDHREDWADTHFTVVDLMDSLCPFHHRLKTQQNWALVEGIGKREFVPPGDPRHPKRKWPRRAGPDPPLRR